MDPKIAAGVEAMMGVQNVKSQNAKNDIKNVLCDIWFRNNPMSALANLV